MTGFCELTQIVTDITDFCRSLTFLRPEVLSVASLCESGRAERQAAKPSALTQRKKQILVLFLAQEKNEKNIHPNQAFPYMGRMQLTTGANRPASGFWYGSQSLCPCGVSHGLFIGCAEKAGHAMSFLSAAQRKEGCGCLSAAQRKGRRDEFFI